MLARPTRLLTPALAAALVLAGGDPASAHPLDATGAGFAQGFAHPFGGLDHALAMVAVGLWAARLGRPAVWLLPLTFAAVMLLGAALGRGGMEVPLVEAGIAASVLALGALLALDVRPHAALGAAAVGLFALLHGHAHGTELPQAAEPAGYMAGFVLATLALHGAGIGSGVAIGRARFVRVAGAGIAAAGLVLVLGHV